MNKLVKYLAASSAVIVLGIGAAVAADAPPQKARDQKVDPVATKRSNDQKARDQKAETPPEADLRAEIASPITGEFSAAAQISRGAQPDVGGHNGSGFLSPTGQPSSQPSGTPGNPGPSSF